MRTLSLVDCVVLKFNGSVLKNAICFGDVDNDGLNEFIIGSSEGELSIFREDQCLCTSSDLGAIAALAVGDLLNIEKNVLVAVTIEGWCHIFDVESELASFDRAFHVTEGDSPTQFLPPETSMIWPYHSQRIPPNTKSLHLGDVNGDGLTEMVLGLTDRVVRTYQWKSEGLDNSEERLDSGKPCKDGKREELFYGRLYGLNKWEFSSQVGCIALHREVGSLSILVSQPGGMIKKITETTLEETTDEGLPAVPVASSGSSTITSSLTSKGGSHPPTVRTPSETLKKEPDRISRRTVSAVENITIDYFMPIDTAHATAHDAHDTAHGINQSISCEVTGNVIASQGEHDYSYAVATMDGKIIIARNSEVQWKLEVEHQITSLFQVNGSIFACTWDGDTYFIQDKVPTRFHFEDSVATFIPGFYGVREEGDSSTTDEIVNKLCMAFVTFDEKVYIYPVPASSG